MKATFAAGCFWHVEDSFMHLKGVKSTRVGYTGGVAEKPSYQLVCTGVTGHAEAVEVEYDPKIISYGDLLAVFWKIHDPTTQDRQGPDVGNQYRSAIFYHDEAQRKAAERSKQAEQKKHKQAIVTQIVKASLFYPAEEYHQNYFEKHGLHGSKVCPRTLIFQAR
ncbi:peptide-methionine (S)-S-oxide reductase MsrA [Candidatus Woesearchaeota archaeon]|nr:peptide-methionine (S)-S-oxide reductase MsrA [Candidatus Woesearchaeota archaeon]